MVGVLGIALTLAASMVGAQPARPRDAAEQRIDRALAFLKSMQDAAGAWQLERAPNTAATGLAVMALLSAGHVPGEGPYGVTVEKGIRWVLRQQSPEGVFDQTPIQMYHQGICTLMLAEAAGMTDAKLGAEVRAGLGKAVKVILKAQATEGTDRGGWRYNVDSNAGDVSVTGWQILALRAAKNLGCDVPAERIDQAMAYLASCRDPATGGFCYTPGGQMTVACTGTAVLCLEICSKDRPRSREALQGGSVLLRTPPQWNSQYFFYSIYYGAQATFQLGNNYWNFYRPHLHKVLFDHQQNNGSWIDDQFGPAYATAMSVLALTVEYRFLPIYQRHEEPGGSK
jgi:prenyltransferase/squalene oxidase-like repeat protein